MSETAVAEPRVDPARSAGTATHCPYCALQCGMQLLPGPPKSGGGVDTGTVVVAARDFPTNRGGLCAKGWSAADLLSPAHRLTTPLLRDPATGQLAAASWSDALDRVADGIRAAQRRYGPDAVGVFGGGGLTNEKAYALGKFARVALGSATIDYNGRFCMSAAATAATAAFGVDRGLPFPLTELAGAQLVVLVGSNVAETMPPFSQYLAAARAAGGQVVTVDPRRTLTAAQSDVHLQPVPGTDLALAWGLLHLVVTAGGVDSGYLAARTTGWEQARAVAMRWWPERTERVTGIPASELRRVADLLGASRRSFLLTARGAEQHSKGSATVSAWINLALALGLPGRPGAGWGTLTGQGNGQGGREHGQKADQLPGYRRLDDPAARAQVAAVWGVPAEALPGPGPSAYELLDGLGRGTQALLVFGSNPVISAPHASHVQQRLAALDLLVVADVVLSETAALADVVLPVAQWAEEDGTMTNLEGRVLRRRRALDPPPGVRTDLQVLHELAGRLGRDADREFPTDPQTVFAELGRASAGGPADYSAISYSRIDAEDGVFWGTERMFAERFCTPDGRARFVPVDHRPAAEEPDADYPLWCTTGRVLGQYQSGAQTRRVAALTSAEPSAFVECHPDLADQLGVPDGQPVTVISRRGRTTVPLRRTPSMRMDTVFLPFHWPGAARANNLTNPALDPACKMPEFKVCAVRLEPAAGSPR